MTDVLHNYVDLYGRKAATFSATVDSYKGDIVTAQVTDKLYLVEIRSTTGRGKKSAIASKCHLAYIDTCNSTLKTSLHCYKFLNDGCIGLHALDGYGYEQVATNLVNDHIDRSFIQDSFSLFKHRTITVNKNAYLDIDIANALNCLKENHFNIVVILY